MAVISENFGALLLPGLRRIFYDQYAALAAESRIPMLFNVLSSTKAVETDRGVGAFADWREYEGTIEYDEMEQLYEKNYTHVQFARGFTVERALYDDDQYNIINKKPAGLAMAAMRKREKDAAIVFNYAFTDSAAYHGSDGEELCASTHEYSPTNASTQTNAGSTALSYQAVVDTREAMRAFQDDRANLIPVTPDLILVPPELEEEVHSIVSTLNKVDITDYHTNFVAAKGLQYMVWDYLTDANNWFLIDRGLMKMYLTWFDRVPVEFAEDPTGDYNLQARYRGYMRYSYGYSDWRWVYGHAVT